VVAPQLPERLTRADVATFTLLSRQSDPELLAAAAPILESLLARQPENPAVLAASIRYHEQMGHERAIVDARRHLADLKGYEDDSRKQEAALWLGKHLIRENPELAGAYLWSAMTWWYNSGNGGDLGRQITRAIDELKFARSHDQGGDRAVDGPRWAAVIDGLVEKILKIYVYPDVAKRMA
jgi:hypothetical protein